MRAVTELELPELEYFDPELRGPRFHAEMEALRERTWLARSPLGVFVLDREAAGFFLRTRSATFPGMKIAELFEIEEGPLLEEMRRNILNLNGADDRRCASSWASGGAPSATTAAATSLRPSPSRTRR